MNELKRLALAMLLAWPALVNAEALSCPPLERSDARAETAVAHAKGLLWKVERGSTLASHLYGTIHVGDPRVTDLPAAVRSALEASRSFTMEATFDMENIAGFAESMYYTDGTQLEDKTGAALYARMLELLEGFGIPALAAEQLRPWAAFMTLNQPAGAGGVPLDLVLMQIAMEHGLPVHGLESLDEQAQLFAGFTDREQVSLLRDTVCHFDVIQTELAKLLDLYLARDLSGIVALTNKYQGSDKALAERLSKALLDERNVRMVERMQPMLAEGGAFIAIGALHLPGKEGILSLLEQRGFRVTAVY